MATGQDELTEIVETLLRKRRVLAELPSNASRDRTIAVLDQMIVDLEMAELDEMGA
jgi:hypothetical protein